MSSQTTVLESATAEILEALAHPLRIRMVKALLERRYCQCELAAKFGAHPVDVSRHLAVLKRAGLVLITREGNKVFPELLSTEISRILKTAESIVSRAAARRAKEARSLKASFS